MNHAADEQRTRTRFCVLNAFRHQRMNHGDDDDSGTVEAGAQRLSASTNESRQQPGGLWSLARCAQRLSASTNESRSSAGRTAHSDHVLNAFRHQRMNHRPFGKSLRRSRLHTVFSRIASDFAIRWIRRALQRFKSSVFFRKIHGSSIVVTAYATQTTSASSSYGNFSCEVRHHATVLDQAIRNVDAGSTQSD